MGWISWDYMQMSKSMGGGTWHILQDTLFVRIWDECSTLIPVFLHSSWIFDSYIYNSFLFINIYAYILNKKSLWLIYIPNTKKLVKPYGKMNNFVLWDD